MRKCLSSLPHPFKHIMQEIGVNVYSVYGQPSHLPQKHTEALPDIQTQLRIVLVLPPSRSWAWDK